jgi:hypothetical protein
MKEIGHWINGKHVKGTSGRFADVFNPATGEVQAKVALATKAELDAPHQTLPKAQVKWGRDQPAAPRPGDDGIRATSDQPRHGQAGRGWSRRSMARPCPTPRATCSAVWR